MDRTSILAHAFPEVRIVKERKEVQGMATSTVNIIVICGFIMAFYPGYNILEHFRVDYTDQIPANGAIFPSGIEEVERRRDITGNTTVTNQYNFGLYFVFEKAPEDDVGATINADWIMDFQEWVQEQSVTGVVPVFGDEPRDERIMAQNGVLFDADREGYATYMVQLSVQFKKKFEVKNKWLT